MRTWCWWLEMRHTFPLVLLFIWRKFGSIQNFREMTWCGCQLSFEEVRWCDREGQVIQLFFYPIIWAFNSWFFSSRNPSLSTFSSPQTILCFALYYLRIFFECVGKFYLRLVLTLFSCCLLLEISFLVTTYLRSVHFCMSGRLLELVEFLAFLFFILSQG